MAEVAFARRFAWFDAIVTGAFRASEIRVAWEIVRSLNEQTNSATLKQPDMVVRLFLGKKTIEQAVQALRRQGYITTDLRAGAGQANVYRLAWPLPGVIESRCGE